MRDSRPGAPCYVPPAAADTEDDGCLSGCRVCTRRGPHHRHAAAVRKGLPQVPCWVVDMDDDGARILDFNETGSGGSTATATSLYVVSLGESMLTGLQNGIMEVDDLGEIDAKPVLRTRVEWLVGMAALHGRCAARLRGISNAAVVA